MVAIGRAGPTTSQGAQGRGDDPAWTGQARSATPLFIPTACSPMPISNLTKQMETSNGNTTGHSQDELYEGCQVVVRIWFCREGTSTPRLYY